jgi:hypothetical protein
MSWCSPVSVIAAKREVIRLRMRRWRARKKLGITRPYNKKNAELHSPRI